MAQTTGRVPIPEMRRTDTSRFGGISRVGLRSYSNAPTMRFGRETMPVGAGPGSYFGGGGMRSRASRDPISRLASVRRGIDAAGRRAWGDAGPPPSAPQHRSRFEQFNPTGRPYGAGNPKRLSYRRFTSKWISGGPGQLLQPNPMYQGGSGDLDYNQMVNVGMGRMPGGTYSYGQRAGQLGFRQTV